MPTILTHPAVALVSRWFPGLSRGAVVAGVIGTIVPDGDVAAFTFGIPYGHTFGHRGFTHSIAFAALFALLATVLVRGRFGTFAFVFACTMSHGVLDAFTDGGLGVAFFSPFSNHRYFFPWQPIRVSPLGAGFFRARGLETLRSELVWVWLPCAALHRTTRRTPRSRRGCRPLTRAEFAATSSFPRLKPWALFSGPRSGLQTIDPGFSRGARRGRENEPA